MTCGFPPSARAPSSHEHYVCRSHAIDMHEADCHAHTQGYRPARLAWTNAAHRIQVSNQSTCFAGRRDGLGRLPAQSGPPRWCVASFRLHGRTCPMSARLVNHTAGMHELDCRATGAKVCARQPLVQHTLFRQPLTPDEIHLKPGLICWNNRYSVGPPTGRRVHRKASLA